MMLGCQISIIAIRTTALPTACCHKSNMAITDALCHCAKSVCEKTKAVVGRDAAAQAAVLLIMLPADQLEVVSLFIY